jgi:RNA polymerase sigma factor (sigma-70 family)
MGLNDADRGEDDAALLERWGRGDRGAARDLLTKYVEELSRFFRTQQPTDAEDLMQETLLAVIEARARFRGDSSFRTYLLRVARYKLWSLRRRRNTQHVLWEDAEEDPVLQAATATEPGQGAELSLSGDDLEAALQRLSPALSSVLVLNFEKKLGRDAIARELGIPPGTVASRIRLAKTQLKALLEHRDPIRLQM